MQKVSRLIDSFTPESYQLSFHLDRTKRTFNGIVIIRGSSHAANTLRLHAKELTIQSAQVDGHAVTFSQHANDELELASNELTAGSHVVTLEFSGTITDQMHGLYPCYFTSDGKKKELLATQFESHHAREVFPCVDEPEAKATFELTLTTETGVETLSNMPIHEQHEEDGLLVTSFEKTPRMSSYLLAFVVGELQKKSAQTNSGVEVNVWATPAQSSASLDFALDIAVRATEFYDEYFDTPYPLPKCDHVALPDFSSGAMENWGLITYREMALLADPKTTSISAKHYIATVITHELAHQWFGNLVTMKWWNDLWLNESFATLMEYIAVDALHPEWQIWLDFASHESIMALRRDAIDGVQSVQVDVQHPDEISTLFDGAIVYAKGARLLHMLETYVGKEAFRAGLATYFKKNAYGNTEAKDLWLDIETASGKPVSELMNIWISQSGYPVLTVTEDTLTQTQFFIGEHSSEPRLWPIPLGATDPTVPALMNKQTIDVLVQPTVRFNDGNSAHFITHYSPEHLSNLLENLASFDPITRLQLLHEQTLLARGRVISSAELVPLIDAYKDETIESVWDILGLTISELKKFVEDDVESEPKLRELAGRIAAREYNRLGWDMKPNEPETDTKLRVTILGLMLYCEEPTVLSEALTRYNGTQDISELPAELRSLLISNLVRHNETPELIDSLISTYSSTSSSDLQSDIAVGLSSTKQAATIQRLLDNSKDASIVRTQDAFRWFVYLIRNRYGREISWQWLQNNWQWVVDTFSGDKSYDDYPRYAASGLVTRKQLEEYTAFFSPFKDEPALSRTIALGMSEIAARVELIEADSQAVRNALLK